MSAQMPLLLRWSVRDLRARWGVVVALALVIALGTGTYAALMSTSAWRRQSNDASFAKLHVHDIRVSLAEGSTAAEGTLLELVRGIPHADAVAAMRERLVVPTQVAGPHDLLVPGEVVGTATGPGSSGVDDVSRAAGSALTPGAGEAGRFVLDRAFARENELPDSGRLTLSGDRTVTYVGIGQSPEYFLVTGGRGGLPFLSQKSYAVLFGTLHGAQRTLGAPGRVNDLVLTVRSGASVAAVQRELRAAITAARPAIAADVTGRRDIGAYRVLYDDIDSDAQLWRVIALLILAGSAFAALNLTSRIVEAQRREIGVGMALGLTGRRLAVRPLLFSAEVALLGVALGVGVGLAVGAALRWVFVTLIPLPIWRTPFQLGVFSQAAALGFALPFLAVAWAVFRAVRVEPVDAIRVGHLSGRGAGLAALSRRIRLPGSSWRHVPFRNLLRTPRRTILTALGIAAAITTLVTTMGFVDTFNSTLDRSQAELLHTASNRIDVVLTAPEPQTADVVTTIRSLPQISRSSPALLLETQARHAGHEVDLLTQTLPTGAPWTPTISSGAGTGGIILAGKAARDLHVGVGDTITLRHAQADVGGRLRTVTTPVRVAGLHPNPMRTMAYLDSATAQNLHLGSLTNVITVLPARDATINDVRRALLAIPHVASAEAVTTTTSGMKATLQDFLGILRVGAAITLLLALLIAFNTASISGDERTREHATMLAFGLPVRSVIGLTVTEAATLGTIGSGLGVLGGFGVLSWLTTTTVPTVMPEIGVSATVAGTTIVTALLLGIVVVAAAPLLTTRRLTRLDVPASLRVVE